LTNPKKLLHVISKRHILTINIDMLELNCCQSVRELEMRNSPKKKIVWSIHQKSVILKLF
jgi:hypothetical protein